MSPQPGKPWFCNDVEGEGWSWHATAAEAMDEAARCIQEWRTGDGWAPEAEEIYVGCVTHCAMQVNKEACPEETTDTLDGPYTSQCHGPHDYHCDVAMRPFGTPEEPVKTLP